METEQGSYDLIRITFLFSWLLTVLQFLKSIPVLLYKDRYTNCISPELHGESVHHSVTILTARSRVAIWISIAELSLIQLTLMFWKMKCYCVSVSEARMDWILVGNCQFPFSPLKNRLILFLKHPVRCQQHCFRNKMLGLFHTFINRFSLWCYISSHKHWNL